MRLNACDRYKEEESGHVTPADAAAQLAARVPAVRSLITAAAPRR